MQFSHNVVKGCVATVILCCAGQAMAQPDGKRAEVSRFGQFLTLEAPITEAQVAAAGNLAVELQAQAEREEREAVLILQVPPGSSSFGLVSDLARKLTSNDVSRVRTVAWLPKTVSGYHAIIALACHDIVMDEDAALGDVGRGNPVPKEERDFILSIVDRRRNSRLSRGVVQAMLDPSVELLRVQIKGAAGPEQRFLTRAEVKSLIDKNTVVSDSETIKDVNAPGLFNAADAQRSGFMVAKTVETRRDVAKLYDLPSESLRETAGGDHTIKPALIRMHEAINTLTAQFLHRQITTSVADGANLLIFDIDSPGGEVGATMEIADTISELDPSKVTTVAWIKDQAFSGAAIVAFATDRIIIKSDAQIGDIGVIQETAEGGAFEFAEQKVTSVLREYVHTLAQRKDRPPALLEAMVDRTLQVFKVTHPQTGRVTYMSELEIKDSSEPWIKGALVPETREEFFLTLNGERAHELGLADSMCDDFTEVRSKLGIPASQKLEPVERIWVDTFVYVLNTPFFGFSLITLAILCIYLELHLPSGFFGICAAIFFALFFWSRYLGGTAGSLELIMFLLGIGLLALEIFVIPGFGVFGVSGILLITGSLVMASHTFAGMTAGEKFHQSMSSLGSIAGALCTVFIVALVLNRFLPSIPFINKLILTPPGYAAGDEDAPHLDPSVLNEGDEGGPVAAGAVGVASSTLRPAGKATFGDHFLDVVSDGGFIDHGTPVEVIRVAGNRIVVRPVSDPQETA